MRVGTDPLAAAVFAVANNTLEAAGVVTHFLKIMTKPTQITKVALEFGCNVWTDNVTLEDALLAVLLVERRPAPLPVHVEHLARLKFLTEACFEELVAFFVELVLHEVKVHSHLLFLQFVYQVYLVFSQLEHFSCFVP